MEEVYDAYSFPKGEDRMQRLAPLGNRRHLAGSNAVSALSGEGRQGREAARPRPTRPSLSFKEF
jgi:hypothetical protein